MTSHGNDPAARRESTEAHGFALTLAAGRAGDGHAWTTLYRDVAPLVLGYLRAQRAPDAEDVLGDTMFEVVRGLHRFEGDRHDFRSWVLAIAHHRMLDGHRRVQRRPLSLLPPTELDRADGQADPLSDVLAADGVDALTRFLDDLTDEQRSVLLLRTVADLSLAETARVVGKRVGAVKALQHRATQRLRRRLEADGWDRTGAPAEAAEDTRPDRVQAVTPRPGSTLT